MRHSTDSDPDRFPAVETCLAQPFDALYISSADTRSMPIPTVHHAPDDQWQKNRQPQEAIKPVT